MKETHKILGALWFLNTANYMDRIAITFAGPIILGSLNMSPRAFGAVLSAFGVTYMLSQIPGGMLADRWGARRLLIVMPVLWGLSTGATALMTTIAGFVAVRLCLGLAEGLSNGASFKLIGETFPGKERTGAIAITSTAGALGPAIAGPLVGGVIAAYGWQAAFLVLAIPPVVSALINFLVLPGRPSAESGAEQPSAPLALDEARPSLLRMLRAQSTWLFMLAYFAFNIAYWGYHGWMPTYLSKAHHLDIKHLGMLGSIPYLGALVGLLTIGWIGTALHRWRPQLLMACYVLAGLSLYVAFASGTLPGTLAGLTATAFLLHGSVPLFASLMLEMAPKAGRGSYSGIVFTAGQIGGVVAPFVIGVLVQRSGNFASGFALMELSLVAAAAVVLALIALMARTARRASEDAMAAA